MVLSFPYLDFGVRLDDATKILFQHRLVELAEVLLHNFVLLQLDLVLGQGGLEVGQRPGLGGLGNVLHGLDV